MGEERTHSNDFLNECWINSWEQQAIQEVEGECDSHHKRLSDETDIVNKKLWTVFQNAAQCVAVMYKGATDNQCSLWSPFQTAAGNITTLYKESLEGIKKSSELSIQYGHQKKTRELVNWVIRRRHIRRDELLAFLVGKSPPPRSSHLRGSPKTRISLDRMSPRIPSTHNPHNQHGSEDNLSTFREALGIHAAVSSATFSPRRRNSAHLPELQSFICDEFARHKRPAPSSSPTHDVTMDSPQHKRFKYF